MRTVKMFFALVLVMTFVGMAACHMSGGGEDSPGGTEGDEGGGKPSGTYTVSFHTNGATSGTAPAAQTVSADSYIAVPSGSGLSKTGLIFCGWNTNAAGTGTNYWRALSGSGLIPDAYHVTGNVTLYANWFVLSGTYSHFGVSGISFTFNNDGTCTYTVTGMGSETDPFSVSGDTISTDVCDFLIISKNFLVTTIGGMMFTKS